MRRQGPNRTELFLRHCVGVRFASNFGHISEMATEGVTQLVPDVDLDAGNFFPTNSVVLRLSSASQSTEMPESLPNITKLLNVRLVRNLPSEDDTASNKHNKQ